MAAETNNLTFDGADMHYLGPSGSYSEILAEQLVAGQDVELVPQPTFTSIIDAVHDDETAVGLLAVENSTTSSVHENIDAIFRGELTIVGEAQLAINMHLVGLEGSEPDDVRTVYSHTKALAQCRDFIHARQLQTHEAESTAAAAEVVLAMQDAEVACLGAAVLAERDGLVILAENIAGANNKTRFLLVRRHTGSTLALPSGHERTLKMTMLVDLPDKQNALGQLLGSLAVYDVNLKNIESRPIPELDWEYRLWFDLEAPAENIADIRLTAVEGADNVDVLGVYPPAVLYRS